MQDPWPQSKGAPWHEPWTPTPGKTGPACAGKTGPAWAQRELQARLSRVWRWLQNKACNLAGRKQMASQLLLNKAGGLRLSESSWAVLFARPQPPASTIWSSVKNAIVLTIQKDKT